MYSVFLKLTEKKKLFSCAFGARFKQETKKKKKIKDNLKMYFLVCHMNNKYNSN